MPFMLPVIGMRNESKSARIMQWFGATFLIYLKSYSAAVGAKTLFDIVVLPCLPKRDAVYIHRRMSIV